jgi:23S rRNA (cytosine1962-C5)-methyltransferase
VAPIDDCRRTLSPANDVSYNPFTVHRVYLKSGRERPVLNGHPWIFSGAVETIEGDDQVADVADVFDSRKQWIARGLYNPKSQIRIRVLTWKRQAIDGDFFFRRLSFAFVLRRDYLSRSTDAYRIVNGEGDFLPGLIIDRYGDFCVCQFLTAGMELFKPNIVEALGGLTGWRGIFEKSEGRVRAEEGLEPSVGVLAGETPPDLVPIEENDLKFLVDVRRGQKTGFFLDQRDNRLFLAAVAGGKSVLNCFAYSGAFSVYAYGAHAKEVTSIDSSRPALEVAERNIALNGFDAEGAELLKGDVFAFLKESERSYDVIVLDPPSLAHKRSDVAAAAGGYKFLNMHALKKLNPGGLLLTFSCSQHVALDLFQKIVFGAAVDAGRKVSMLRRLGPPIDHPISLHHTEGEYLKGLALRVLD